MPKLFKGYESLTLTWHWSVVIMKHMWKMSCFWRFHGLISGFHGLLSLIQGWYPVKYTSCSINWNRFLKDRVMFYRYSIFWQDCPIPSLPFLFSLQPWAEKQIAGPLSENRNFTKSSADSGIRQYTGNWRYRNK